MTAAAVITEVLAQAEAELGHPVDPALCAWLETVSDCLDGWPQEKNEDRTVVARLLSEVVVKGLLHG